MEYFIESLSPFDVILAFDALLRETGIRPWHVGKPCSSDLHRRLALRGVLGSAFSFPSFLLPHVLWQWPWRWQR